MLRHRPVGPERAAWAVMHRVFVAQALKPRPQRVAAEQFRVGDVVSAEWRGVGLGAGFCGAAVQHILHGDTSSTGTMRPRRHGARKWLTGWAAPVSVAA